ncbi:MAG: inositol monophosphatase [Planctomycetota bacterium]|nr:MAG: inositol monophosphatase [Planctomycetota bacterium]
MAAVDWAAYCEVARRAAEAGAERLLEWAGRFSVREKSRANLVTEADFASQKAIAEVLLRHFPGHALYGEEGLRAGPEHAEFRWLIDPLDGTSNYVHGFPYYAVSIGLEYRGRLVLGVVLDPNRGETFWGWTDGGAWCNGRRIRTSDHDALKQALVVASLPVGVDATHYAVRRFLAVFPRAQALQRTGSAALNLVGVAAGRIDAFFSSSLKPWDMAAGVVIVREAGGRVTRQDGGEFDVYRSDLLASNGTRLHQELVEVLSSVPAEAASDGGAAR